MIKYRIRWSSNKIFVHHVEVDREKMCLMLYPVRYQKDENWSFSHGNVGLNDRV